MSHAQSLPEMNGITIAVTDLDQSNFTPWGLREKPVFYEHNLNHNPNQTGVCLAGTRGNGSWVDTSDVCHSGLGVS